MKKLNVKAFIQILVGLSVSVWIGLLYFFDIGLHQTWQGLRLLPAVVTVDLGVWLIFARWGWKLPFFQGWLVPSPVLEGTWQGEIHPTRGASAKESVANPIPVVLVVKQSFLSTSATMYSQEMVSRSYAAEFLVDSDTGLKKVVYTYTSVPRLGVRERSRVHDGTALLEIIDKPERRLSGEYWTNRQTIGEMTLRYRTRQLLEDFPQDLVPAPANGPVNGG